jgi:Zn-dependent protease with chaperone function
MITGTGGLLLHLWLAVGLSVLGAALLMALIQPRLLAWLSCFNVTAKQRFLWCIALFPYGAGLYAATLVLTPALTHEFLRVDHGHLHSLQGHFHWFSWQGAGVLLLSTVAGWKLLTMLWRRSRQHHQLQTLLAFSEVDATGCYRVESDIPNAFTLGLLNPKILISRALDRALTADELAIVYRHELAHQRARDPLRLSFFGMLISVFIPSARQELYATLELLIEQQADAEVASQFCDPSTVAATLVKVNRLALRYQRQAPDFSACGFCSTAIEARIQQLLGSDHGRTFPIPTFLLSTFALVAVGMYYANSLHHSIETLLHYHP